MSKPRLTKQQKKIRKELIKYYRNLPENKEARKASCKAGVFAIVVALAINELIKGGDE